MGLRERRRYGNFIQRELCPGEGDKKAYVHLEKARSLMLLDHGMNETYMELEQQVRS